MSGGQPPGGLTDPALEALWRLTSAAAVQVVSTELRGELRDIRDRLAEPLRLAIMGAVSSGKSTLVNALLRMPVAAKGSRETTKVVAWLQYGPGDDDGKVLIDALDGAHETRLLPGNVLPDDLGVPDDEIDRIRIFLDNETLRDLTIIDTPGSNTTTGLLQQRADRALREDAQAIMFLSDAVSTQDRETLASFQALCRAGEFSAINALLVLTKVDTSQSPDPWPAARDRAQSRLDQLPGLAFDAVPVAATIAETGGAELLTPEHLSILRGLLVMDPIDRSDAILDPGIVDVPWSLEDQAVLSERLRTYGFHVALNFLAANPGARLGDLHAELRRCSGFDPDPADGEIAEKTWKAGRITNVASAVDLFGRRAGQLKALATMNRLSSLLTIPNLPPTDRHALLNLLRALDSDPRVLEQLRELRVTLALDAAGRERLPLPPERYTELLCLAANDHRAARVGLPPETPAAKVRERSLELARSWRALATSATGSVAGRHLHDVLDVLEEMAQPSVGELPFVPTGLDAGILDRLDAIPVITDLDRELVAAAAESDTLGGQVGLDEHADGPAIAERAAALVNRFRTLSHRPLTLADRRAVLACVDAFEAVWAAASSPHLP